MILPKRLLLTSYLLICRLVIETLEGVEKDRKCFRMVGGVLVERKVGEVEPALTSNRDKVRFHGKASWDFRPLALVGSKANIVIK